MSRSRICLVLALAGSPLLSASVSHAETAQVATPSSVPAALIQLGVGDYYSPYAFVVDKKNRRLSIWNQKDHRLSEVASFPIDFGRNGGDKRKRGDLNTPEGIYFLMQRMDGPGLDFKQYGSRAFTTNYPNLFDEREGKTGNGIWLHAVPDDTPLTRGSRGCVVVRDDVIKDITKYVTLQQTPIVIFNEVPSVDASEQQSTLNVLRSRLESWRMAWEGKNLSEYMSFYSSNFESMKMNRDKWEKFKSGLNREYKLIQVKLSEPVIYRHKDTMVMRFLQAYQSDRKADYGEKTLYWREEGGVWKIVAEQWGQVSNPIAFRELPPFNSAEATAICRDCGEGNAVSQNPVAASSAVRN